MTPFAQAPALPLHTAGPYVAAAYIVFVVLLLVYLGIMGMRLTRNQREIVELRRQLQARNAVESRGPEGIAAGAELPGERPGTEFPGERQSEPVSQQ